MTSTSTPQPDATAGGETLRQAVFRLVRSLPAFAERPAALDLSCGDGDLLAALSAAGYNARGTTFRDRDDDYIRRRDHPEALRVDGGIDLNVPLPYDDASFDLVTSTEVIEHVEGHRNLIGEAARVLRPGGHLVLTTPNLNRLRSRLAFALTGVHQVKQVLPSPVVSLSRMEEFHHRCVDLPHLHWLLWQSGLRIKAAEPTEVWRSSRLLSSVLRPLVRRSTRRAVDRVYVDAASQAWARDDLVRWLTHPVLLTSERLCLLCQKEEC